MIFIYLYYRVSLYHNENKVPMNIFREESFVKNIIFARLLINFITLASLYLWYHESVQKTS